MSTAQLILEWAKLLLQWQVLAVGLAVMAMYLWKDQIRNVIQAIAERGGKITAGPISGEIEARAGEGAMPIADAPQASDKPLDKEAQQRTLDRLALRFDDLVARGSNARRAFVEDIRRDYRSGWTWDFLKGTLEASRMPTRFCAASLIVSVVGELDPIRIAHLLSSSTVLLIAAG